MQRMYLVIDNYEIVAVFKDFHLAYAYFIEHDYDYLLESRLEE